MPEEKVDARPYEEDVSFYVDIQRIVVKERVRKRFQSIDELMESIKKVGLIHPVVVTHDLESPDYILVAGERRLRASLLLGHVQIKCTLLDTLCELDQKAIELEENLKREALTWEEECQAIEKFDTLRKKLGGEKLPGRGSSKGWSQADTADILGESAASVSRKIRLAKTLEERPDIRERVKKMPMYVADKTAKQILEDEKYDRLHEKGLLKRDVSILLGNALELIKDVEDESVGCVITDPPFGIPILANDEESSGRFDYEKGSSEGTSSLSYTSMLKPADNATVEQVSKLFFDLSPELSRVLKPGGHFYIFFAMECYCLFSKLLSLELEVNPVPLVWFKGRVTAPFYGYNYQPCYEPILFGHKPPRTRRLNSALKTVLECGIIPSKQKTHPFEKPSELLTMLIKQSTREGELVLDPFVGSGATVIAARNCGRQGLGFEVDEGHFKGAQRKLEESEA